MKRNSYSHASNSSFRSDSSQNDQSIVSFRLLSPSRSVMPQKEAHNLQFANGEENGDDCGYSNPSTALFPHRANQNDRPNISVLLLAPARNQQKPKLTKSKYTNKSRGKSLPNVFIDYILSAEDYFLAHKISFINWFDILLEVISFTKSLILWQKRNFSVNIWHLPGFSLNVNPDKIWLTLKIIFEWIPPRNKYTHYSNHDKI